LNPEYKALWVAELRSGKYAQGNGRLRRLLVADRFEYCCLGVLCDIINPNGWTDLGFNNEPYSLTKEVRELTGLTEKQAFDLAILNDHHRYTFGQIATYIEEKL
jgi:hypothetical protein